VTGQERYGLRVLIDLRVRDRLGIKLGRT